jgi:hypothetical protein
MEHVVFNNFMLPSDRLGKDVVLFIALGETME